MSRQVQKGPLLIFHYRRSKSLNERYYNLIFKTGNNRRAPSKYVK